jgi:DNA polymerase-3 subunit epsilon
VNATIEVLHAQVERYEKLGDSIDSILSTIGEEKIVDYARRFSFNEKGIEVFNFGKFKGMAVTDVLKKEPQYYDWMMKGDFPLHTKQKLTELLNRTLLKNH